MAIRTHFGAIAIHDGKLVKLPLVLPFFAEEIKKNSIKFWQNLKKLIKLLSSLETKYSILYPTQNASHEYIFRKNSSILFAAHRQQRTRAQVK